MFSNTFLSAAIIAAVFQAANGIFYPVGIAYAQDLATAENLRMHTGAVSGIGHLVAGVSGFIVGALASSFGFESVGWLFLGSSLIMVVAIGLTHDPRLVSARAPALTPIVQ